METKNAVEQEYYTTDEVAVKLHVPRRTVEKWVYKKQIPVLHCGRLLRFPRLEIHKRELSGNLLNAKGI